MTTPSPVPFDEMTPQFRAHLECEITRAIRREARFGSRLSTVSRRLRSVAVVVACLAIGFAANLAHAQVQVTSRRDSLLASAQADLQLLQMRLDLAQREAEAARKKAAAGVVMPSDVEQAEAAAQSLEARVKAEELNIAEIRATKLPPRDELNAPLVDGRDFVSQRLQVNLMTVQQQLQAAENAMADVQRKARIGLASQVAQDEQRVKVAQAQAAMADAARQLALRKQFLAQKTSIDVLSRELERSRLDQELEVARLQAELASARVAAAEREQKVGAADNLDVLKAQVESKQVQLQLQQLVEQLRRVRSAAKDSTSGS
jgi:hypothetical protein